jgi:hypothetical protein
MWKKIAVTAVFGTTIIGSGGAALAASSSGNTPAPAPATTSSGPTTGSTAKAHHHRSHRLAHALHAQWVTHNKKTNADVTHDEIKGTVTAVSANSITVTASDGVTQTYTMGSGTKVHAKGDTKASPGTISQIKSGDRAIVVGTGTSTLTATHVNDHGVAAASTGKPTT